MENDGTPMFFWNGKWSPICGEWFWDNQNGAQTFCKKLGYTNGNQQRTNEKYDQDAVQIGRCNADEDLEECSAGCNDKVVGKGCAACAAGGNVAITITCEGPTSDTVSSSCEGISQIAKGKCTLFFLKVRK